MGGVSSPWGPLLVLQNQPREWDLWGGCPCSSSCEGETHPETGGNLCELLTVPRLWPPWGWGPCWRGGDAACPCRDWPGPSPQMFLPGPSEARNTCALAAPKIPEWGGCSFHRNPHFWIQPRLPRATWGYSAHSLCQHQPLAETFDPSASCPDSWSLRLCEVISGCHCLRPLGFKIVYCVETGTQIQNHSAHRTKFCGKESVASVGTG